MIVRTEAIVLRSLDYRETSQIVTLYTEAFGKLAVIAKGSRSAKSTFGSGLQPMSHIEALLYHKPGREIQTLKEVSHVQPHLRLGRQLDKLAIGQRMVEFVNALVQPDEQNPQVFSLLAGSLALLDAAEERSENLLLFFQLRLAGILGFQAAVSRQQVEALGERGGRLALESGDVLAEGADQRATRRASRKALRAFAILAHSEPDVVLRMALDDDVRHEVAALVDAYLHYHVDDAYPTRGERVLGTLLHRKG